MKLTTKEQLVVELRRTQKIDLRPCEGCDSVTWECRRVLLATPWPWPEQTDQLSRWQRQSWPWVGGILVTCQKCRRTWFGNASMRQFNQIRDQLAEDGTATVVNFEHLGKEDVGNGLKIAVVEARPVVKRFARPKRLVSKLPSRLKDRLADQL